MFRYLLRNTLSLAHWSPRARYTRENPLEFQRQNWRWRLSERENGSSSKTRSIEINRWRRRRRRSCFFLLILVQKHHVEEILHKNRQMILMRKVKCQSIEWKCDLPESASSVHMKRQRKQWMIIISMKIKSSDFDEQSDWNTRFGNSRKRRRRRRQRQEERESRSFVNPFENSV